MTLTDYTVKGQTSPDMTEDAFLAVLSDYDKVLAVSIPAAEIYARCVTPRCRIVLSANSQQIEISASQQGK